MAHIPTTNFVDRSTVHNGRVENLHLARRSTPIPTARMNVHIRRQSMALDRMRVDKMYARALKKGGSL